jgi:ABC-2 type transport system permease protein
MGRLWAIALKELLQLKRDRMTLSMMAALPVVQILLFGWAIDTDVRHIPTVIYDQDRSAFSRDVAQGLRSTGYYDVRGEVRSYAEIERALRSGEARVALVVPPNAARDARSGSAVKLQLVVDGSDPQTTGSAINSAAGLARARSGNTLVQVEPTTWYNPEQKTAVYVVPGLVGVILTMTMVMLTAMAIARERERGTLEQLIVSPMRRGELILGKILPYVVIGYVQMTLVLLAGWLVFGVTVAGSLPLLYLLALLFIASNLALGLFFSTLAKTQQQAMQMSFFFLLPNILLSGFMFPWDAMPEPARILSQALPNTHFLRIVRGIVLKGATLGDLAPELLWMAGIFLVLVVVASFRFQKKLA